MVAAAADTIAVDEELLMHLAVVSIARAEPLESLFISATSVLLICEKRNIFALKRSSIASDIIIRIRYA